LIPIAGKDRIGLPKHDPEKHALVLDTWVGTGFPDHAHSINRSEITAYSEDIAPKVARFHQNRGSGDELTNATP
jgi:hypothetical protein